MKYILLALALLLISSNAQAFWGNVEQKKSVILWPAFVSGINGSGLEWSSSTTTYGPTALDYYASKGAKAIRIPFKWERMQPSLGADLDTIYLGALDNIVRMANARGMYTLIDCHNYGSYNGVRLDEAGGPTPAQFADLWGKLAAHYKNNEKVALDLMNESLPESYRDAISGIDQTPYMTDQQAAINAIRANGFKGPIHVSFAGYYSNARIIIETGGAEALLTLTDPLNNLVVHLHKYISVGNETTSQIAQEDAYLWIVSATEWARANGKKLFLGETLVMDVGQYYAEMTDFLNYIWDNRDVWVGWTAWGGGSFPTATLYSLNPDASGANPKTEFFHTFWATQQESN